MASLPMQGLLHTRGGHGANDTETCTMTNKDPGEQHYAALLLGQGVNYSLLFQSNLQA